MEHIEAPESGLCSGYTHAPEIMILELSGPDAARNSYYRAIMAMLKLTKEEVKALYRFESHTNWFLKTTPRIRAKLLNQDFGDENSFFIRVRSYEPERVWVTIHWLSAEIKPEFVKTIFAKFADHAHSFDVIRNSGPADQ